MTQPTTSQAAAEEISVRLFGPGDEPMTRIIQGILAKHYAAQAAEVERLKAKLKMYEAPDAKALAENLNEEST